jgi:hypothetical protein
MTANNNLDLNIINCFKFKICDEVFIEELQRRGRVISIWITECGIKYEVRYFDEAKIQTVYFYENEIAHIRKGK